MRHRSPIRTLAALAAMTLASSTYGDDAAPVVVPAEEITAETPDIGSETPQEKRDREWIQGRFSAGFDADWDRAGSDLELHQQLRLSIEPPKAPRLRLHTSVWMTEDLDGDEPQNSSLRGIDDRYGSDVRLRVLDMYLQAEDVLGGAELRLGRQRMTEGPRYNRIDGLRLRWEEQRWDAYVYAGSRASLYEGSFEDLVVGAGAGYRLSNSTRIGLDLYHAKDHRDDDEASRRGWLADVLGRAYPRKVETRVEDSLLGLTLYHRFNENHWLNAQVQLQDDGAHEYSMDLSGLIARWDLTYLLHYRCQFERVDDRVNDLSGYYRILGSLEPYHHLHFGVQRPLTETLFLGLDTDIHDSGDEADLSANRDYVRIAATLSGRNIGKGYGFQVSLGQWNTSGSDDSWHVTGEVSRKWNAYEVALGADFEQYRFEYVDYNPWPKWIKSAIVLAAPGIYPGFSPGVLLTDTREVLAREEIQSYFARFAWKIDDRQRVSARLTYEEDDGPYAPHWRFRAGYELDF